MRHDASRRSRISRLVALSSTIRTSRPSSSRCGAATRPHRVCENCGHYGFDKGGQKGVAVLPKEEF